LIVILAINLVLLQYDFGRLASLWISIAVFAIIYLYDFWITANAKQKNAFYIPMFVEAIAFSIGYILYRFEFPDRLCRNNRFSQLYLSGWIFFTILVISCIYEAHCILYYTLKLNRGNYNPETDDWWSIKNLFY
jgi:predicted membrane channel-forming protein YqfA (hemolysin III family)